MPVEALPLSLSLANTYYYPSGSIPIGVAVMAIALAGIPTGFPYQNRPDHLRRKHVGAKVSWARFDVPGAVLIFLATLAFTAGFQEAGSRFSWDSAYVITLLVMSAVLWAALMLWERHVTLQSKIREPVLPWRFFTNRKTVGLMA